MVAMALETYTPPGARAGQLVNGCTHHLLRELQHRCELPNRYWLTCNKEQTLDQPVRGEYRTLPQGCQTGLNHASRPRGYGGGYVRWDTEKFGRYPTLLITYGQHLVPVARGGTLEELNHLVAHHPITLC
jgi:hypothetical protein